MSNSEAAEKLIEDTLDGEHYDNEQLHLLAAIGYALLDVAGAIREQTEVMQREGVTVKAYIQ